MPELNLAAPPASTAVTTANAAGTSGDGMSSATGSDSGAQGPFAAVLGKQIAAGKSAEEKASSAQPQASEDPTAAAPTLDLSALMPILLGMSAATAAPGKSVVDPAVDQSESMEKIQKESTDGGRDPAVLLATASAAPGAVTQKTPDAGSLPVTDDDDGQNSPSLPTAASATAKTSAILAGTPGPSEQAAAENGNGKSEGGFAALLSATQSAQSPVIGQGPATGAPAAAGQHGAAVAHVDTAVGSHGWNEAVADKVVWMANQQQGKAELVLNPPQMGRIEVSLTVNGDQANAVFVSSNPEVRQALESALPRLREVMADAGINLGQAQVGAQSSGNSSGKGENRDNSSRGQTSFGQDIAAVGDVAASSRNPWAQSGRGLVDTFA